MEKKKESQINQKDQVEQIDQIKQVDQKKKEYRMELKETEIIHFKETLTEEELNSMKQGIMEKIKKSEENKNNRNDVKFPTWHHWKKWGTAAALIALIFGFFSPSVITIASKFYKSLPIAEKISNLFQAETKQDGYRLDVIIKQEEENDNKKEEDGNKQEKNDNKQHKNNNEDQEESLMEAVSFIKNIHISYPDMKNYSNHEKDGWYYFNHKGGSSVGKDFDFQLLAVDQTVETGFFVDDIAAMEEIMAGEHKIIYIERNNVKDSRYHDNTDYTKRMIILFEEEGYMIQLYAMAGLEEEKLLEFSENIILEKCKKKEASSYITLSEYFKHNFDTKGQENNAIIKTIRKDQVVSINEIASRLGIEYKVKNVQVLDNISKLWEENGKGFNDCMDIWKHRFQYADKKGNLKSYIRETIEIGNGITAPLERVIASEEIAQKFVLVELYVKNTTEQERESEQICLHIDYLQPQGNGWIDDKASDAYCRPKIIDSCQLDRMAQYFKEADEGAGFYLKTLAPGEEETYHIGYFVDEDLLSSMFLSIDGGVWTGEYNGTMIDIRQ